MQEDSRKEVDAEMTEEHERIIPFIYGTIFIGLAFIDFTPKYLDVFLNFLGLFCFYKSIMVGFPEYPLKFDNLYKVLISLILSLAVVLSVAIIVFIENSDTLADAIIRVLVFLKETGCI